MKKLETDTDARTPSAADILESTGRPVPPSPTARQKWQHLSKLTRALVLSIAALVALIASSLSNIETIREHIIGAISSPPRVPPITVKLSNSSHEDISVSVRGDFMLWLPGQGARYTEGKYEFHLLDGLTPENGQVNVPPSQTVAVAANILNQSQYGRILEQEDCDIGLVVRNVKGGIKISDAVPFKMEAIRKYFIAVDLGAEK